MVVREGHGCINSLDLADDASSACGVAPRSRLRRRRVATISMIEDEIGKVVPSAEG